MTFNSLGMGLNSSRVLALSCNPIPHSEPPCFAPGTPIRTRDGSRPIEQFKAGDLLPSRDENDPNAPIVEQEIIELFSRVSPIILLRVGHQEVRTTAEHPFYARERGWIPAGMLEAGEWLLTGDGGWVVIESVGVNGEVVTVYNFDVAEYHTYFVGEESWGFELWTHNHPADQGGPTEVVIDGKKHPESAGHA